MAPSLCNRTIGGAREKMSQTHEFRGGKVAFKGSNFIILLIAHLRMSTHPNEPLASAVEGP